MSDKLGPVTFRQDEPHPFLGREIAEQRDFSEETARIIDEEIQKIVRDMERKAVGTLDDNLKKLYKLAEALIENETLEKEEVDQLLTSSSARAEAI